MDEEESEHTNGMLMLYSFLAYAEKGLPPPDYILEHFAICFRKILTKGTYTFDEDVLEHPQFAHKLDTKAMGTLVRKALYISKPYTTDKDRNDAEWFYSLDEEVFKHRSEGKPEGDIFGDITEDEFEAAGQGNPTHAQVMVTQERFRKLTKKFGSRAEARASLNRVGLLGHPDSRNKGQKSVDENE